MATVLGTIEERRKGTPWARKKRAEAVEGAALAIAQAAHAAAKEAEAEAERGSAEPGDGNAAKQADARGLHG